MNPAFLSVDELRSRAQRAGVHVRSAASRAEVVAKCAAEGVIHNLHTRAKQYCVNERDAVDTFIAEHVDVEAERERACEKYADYYCSDDYAYHKGRVSYHAIQKMVEEKEDGIRFSAVERWASTEGGGIRNVLTRTDVPSSLLYDLWRAHIVGHIESRVTDLYRRSRQDLWAANTVRCALTRMYAVHVSTEMIGCDEIVLDAFIDARIPAAKTMIHVEGAVSQWCSHNWVFRHSIGAKARDWLKSSEASSFVESLVTMTDSNATTRVQDFLDGWLGEEARSYRDAVGHEQLCAESEGRTFRDPQRARIRVALEQGAMSRSWTWICKACDASKPKLCQMIDHVRNCPFFERTLDHRPKREVGP
jgi:hypothetical protein